MTEIERLIAIEEIKFLKARRIRAMDEKDYGLYEQLHAPEHVSDTYHDHTDDAHGGQPAIGAKANTERLAQTLDGVVTVHHAHTPEIEFSSPTTATGVWAMEDRLFWKQGDEEHWLHGFGHYHERYEKRDGQWRFVYRRLTRLRVETSPGARMGTQTRSN